MERDCPFAREYPWEKKKSVAVFRGGSRTCYPEDGDEAAISSSAVKYLLDQKMLSCGRDALKFAAKHCAAHLLDVEIDANNMPLEEQERFKYIVYAEGHGGWANRLKTILGMQSAVIMQVNNGNYEWYSQDLQPWVHYIPVDHLFISLPAVIEWANRNDHLVKAISMNADRYFDRYLSASAMTLRLGMLLKDFASLFHYKIERLPESTSYKDFLNFRNTIYGAANLKRMQWD